VCVQHAQVVASHAHLLEPVGGSKALHQLQRRLLARAKPKVTHEVALQVMTQQQQQQQQKSAVLHVDAL
jgi:hypothetical protein